MTHEEFINNIKDLDDQIRPLLECINSLKIKKDDLKKLHIEDSEFKLEQKVLVTYTGWDGSEIKEQTCCIGRIWVTDSGIKYQFNQIKKDGTISLRKEDIRHKNVKSIKPVN